MFYTASQRLETGAYLPIVEPSIPCGLLRKLRYGVQV